MNGFYEFFSGGGMARAGFGSNWTCLFANDFDAKKADIYLKNWGQSPRVEDINKLTISDLPGHAAAAWASFPCQDLSQAGAQAGLTGARSGTFWAFWRLIQDLRSDSRAPQIILLENVVGMLTHKRADFIVLCEALAKGGYRPGAMVIDASLFLPHSRPRVFIVAVRDDVNVPPGIMSASEIPPWHSKAVITAHAKLQDVVKKKWIWWKLEKPDVPKSYLEDVIDHAASKWHSQEKTNSLIAMMTDKNRNRITSAVVLHQRLYGAAYQRTRRDKAKGTSYQIIDVRFDISGCLRTPSGGSSREIIFVIEHGLVRSRLITARETARLMGLPDSYILPENYNEAYHLTGDGVAVPVVNYIVKEIVEPILYPRG